ncbi:hydrogenase maturation peptidase hycI [Streptomyces laurentii]|uniref:Hydrogenase maturation peptidase hycI n=1 Tax=Streptomyces laurentii TaxID=39478 RepID=A0A160P7L3_STRLU|nr:hydrogenase maturation peptidase hycI [Streptomyces laurentii]
MSRKGARLDLRAGPRKYRLRHCTCEQLGEWMSFDLGGTATERTVAANAGTGPNRLDLCGADDVVRSVSY